MGNLSPTRVTLIEQVAVFAVSLLASIVAVWWSWTNNAFLLYGDAEAHIHIARRLFDSHRPGITQLGSVWLPLSHLMLVPFLAVDSWWRSGFAPVIPSAACYLLACLGLYRLMRKWLSPAAAWVGLALFASNPNLLYLQTTAMSEPLFLCELIWSALLLVEWHTSLDTQVESRKLWLTIAVLVAAVYTRYDGWILAFLAWVAMAACLYRRGRLFRASFIAASVVLMLAPAGWMAYNAFVFRDWLDFMRGPYSAKAIELRTSTSAVDPHPGWHNPWVSLVYFVKAAEMDAAALGWGEFILAAAALGTGWAWLRFPTDKSAGFITHRSKFPIRENWLWTLFLWLPLPFYAYSVSYGSVPIFLPVWKPFSYYNTRYGMELLPALAFFFAFAVEALLLWTAKRYGKFRPAMLATIFLLLVANVALMLHQQPLVYIEAKKNNEARSYYNRVFTEALKNLHRQSPNALVLMDTSNFPSIVPHSGMTYRQTINESDKYLYWAALAAPAAHADIVLAFAGTEIDKAVKAHPEHLRLLQTFHSPNKGWDQLDADLYVSDNFPATHPDPAHPQP